MTSPALRDLTGDFVLDPTYTRLGFVARHAMVTRVQGVFEQFRGHTHLDRTDPAHSRVLVEVETASVNTGIKQRDAHLRTGDFLDAPHYPLMTYHSSQVTRVGQSVLTMEGELTLRGITNPLALDFHYHGATTDALGEERLWFVASTVISRRAWGVAWSGAVEAGGIVVADKVTLDLDVCARHVSSPDWADDASATELPEMAGLPEMAS
jgi:polyisoprenoid-binding protein YceI